MSKFIITNKIEIQEENEEKEIITRTEEQTSEFNTPEEALSALTPETIQIREEYVNGMAVISRDDLVEMIEHKKVCEEIEKEKLNKKEKE